ncbi:MAG TPA: hypothetical protein VI548_10475 [Chitinophagaceae bacterium]|nr:hypothetical protein [Chitinophagaceae bacterium]
MGLSIHYSGKIRHPDLIKELVAEVADICNSLNWTSHIINEPNEDELNGICFSPEGCEPVFLTFLPGGRMCSPVNLMNRDIYEKNDLDKELMYTTSTKTQFAGPDAHMALIKLLRYLEEKYFEKFDLQDEGKFWETNDKKILLEQFARYEFLLNTVGEALSNMKTLPGESADSLADRIEKMLRKKLGGKNN